MHRTRNFQKYFLTDDDNAEGERDWGFGSTKNKTRLMQKNKKFTVENLDFNEQ